MSVSPSPSILARRSTARRPGEKSCPAGDQYTEQAEAFALAVLGAQPLPRGVEDAIKSMKVPDAILASEKVAAG